MEFDRRRTRWPHWLGFVLYTMAVVYLLLNANPYLYSHRELGIELAGEKKDTVKPVPAPDRQDPVTFAGGQTFWPRLNANQSNHDPRGITHDREFAMEWIKPVTESTDFTVRSWAADEHGVFVVTDRNEVLALSPEGDPKWKFEFKNGEKDDSLDLLVDDQLVYVTKKHGQMVALRKADGRLRWHLRFASDVVSSGLLIDNEIWIAVRPLDTEIRRLSGINKEASRKKAPTNIHRFARINRATGELVSYSSAFEIKGSAELTHISGLELLVMTTDNKIHALNVTDGQTAWSQATPDPIVGPSVYAEGKLFVALSSGKIQAWDPGKKGKFEWEVDLDNLPQRAPTYIPAYQRLAVITSDQFLHMVDIKKAEHLWRFNLDNRNLTSDLLVLRLSGKWIEQLQLKWERKGWTAWAPCSENRLCIYNPDRGQNLARINLPGKALSPPLFQGKSFYILVQDKKEKGRVNIAYFMEADALKRKQAAANQKVPGT